MKFDLLNSHNLIKYLYAFFIATFIIVYLFKIPNLLTQANHLIKEYYYDNFIQSTLLDIILIFIYLFIGIYIIHKLNIKNNLIFQIFIIFFTSFFISSIFYIIFINYPKTDLFFSRWFHTVGIKALIYDGIILSTVYFIYNYLQKNI
tara:strand:+ start:567 stop:1007 length:441 start_codon:yes stop_codon:yes gene_type:complete